MTTGYEDRTELSVFIAVARQDATEQMAMTLQSSIGGLWAQIARWRQRRATSAALARLDDRILRDIGLTRDQVRAAAIAEMTPAAHDEPAPTLVRAATSAPGDRPARGSNDNLRQSRAA